MRPKMDISGMMLLSPHYSTLPAFKSDCAAFWVMNDFPSCNPFPVGKS